MTRRRAFSAMEVVVALAVVVAVLATAAVVLRRTVHRSQLAGVRTTAESISAELVAIAAQRLAADAGQTRSSRDRFVIWEARLDFPERFTIATEGADGTPVLLQRADGARTGVASSIDELAPQPVWLLVARDRASVCVRLSADGTIGPPDGAAFHGEVSSLAACDHPRLEPQPLGSGLWASLAHPTGAFNRPL
jgi:hypothetical protein